jgi:hypothetical protein
LLKENVHFNLLEGLECDRSLNLIHFIALWLILLYFCTLEKYKKSIEIVPFKWAPLAPLIVYLPGEYFIHTSPKLSICCIIKELY